MDSPGTDVQSNVALRSSQIQAQLSKYALPALRTGISALLSDLGDPGTEPASVRTEFTKARDRTNADFDAAKTSADAQIKQEILQSGAPFTPEATAEVTGRTDRLIDRQRTQAISGMRLQEAQAGMDQTSFLLSSASRAGGQAVNGALGFGSNAISAGSILNNISQQNQQQGSTYGALVGTILGAALSSYTGGLSIPLGSAAGGAVGGWIGGGM